MNDTIEFKPSGNPEKKSVGVGMPASIYLQQFGQILSDAFDGAVAYHVGSSLTGTTWRDVDIRILLDLKEYKAMGLGNPKSGQENAKWCALCMAFSELGRKMTGLPIDFQIQEIDTANAQYPCLGEGPDKHRRSALILESVRRIRQQEEPENPNNKNLTVDGTLETILKHAPSNGLEPSEFDGSIETSVKKFR